MREDPLRSVASGSTSIQMQAKQPANRPLNQGWFITFEGPDGSGKTTQLDLQAARLLKLGLPVITLRQPGGTPLGERIRGLLVNSGADAAVGPISPFAELGLMFSDRAQAIAEMIAPALADGKIVLCDRFTDSTEAYQGGGRELGREVVMALHQYLCGGLEPDLTVLLLPPLASALRRARARTMAQIVTPGLDESRFEQEPDSFYERVFAAYEAIARRAPERVMSIREDTSVDAIEAQVTSAVDRLLSGLDLNA